MQPNEFVQRMTALWKKPHDSGDVNIAAEEYREALAGFTPQQLDAGWVYLRDNHDRTPWPLISECRKAVMSASVVTNPRPPVRRDDDNEAFANAAMRDPLAVRARAEGWLLGLWDHCYMNGRLPWAQDVGKLRDEARQANAAAANLDRSNPLHKILWRIWEAMRAREARLAALVPSAA